MTVGGVYDVKDLEGSGCSQESLTRDAQFVDVVSKHLEDKFVQATSPEYVMLY